MRSRIRLHTAALFVTLLAIAAGRAEAGEETRYVTSAEGRVQLDKPCPARDLESATTLLDLSIVRNALEEIAEGQVSLGVACAVAALENGSGVKGVKGDLVGTLIAQSGDAVGTSRSLDLGKMRFRTDRSGSWSATIDGQALDSHVPILGDLPIVGALFKAKPKGKKIISELVILCTAEVIHPSE